MDEESTEKMWAFCWGDSAVDEGIIILNDNQTPMICTNRKDLDGFMEAAQEMAKLTKKSVRVRQFQYRKTYKLIQG